MTRQRQGHPPQNGGQACVMLPGGPHSTRQWNQTREWKGGGNGAGNVEGLPALTLPDLRFLFFSGPCPQDGCPSATCSGELVFWPCAPCPLTCDDISGQTVCPADRPCSSPGEGPLGSGRGGHAQS